MRSRRNSRKIEFRGLQFHIPEDVYSPSDDSLILAESFEVREGEEVLELGCGCGINAILAAVKAGKVVATDINPSAVDAARYNAKLNGLTDKLEVRQGDLFDPLRVGEQFDVILFNPPYLPVMPVEKDGCLEIAWQGGGDGRAITDRFLDRVKGHLKKMGRIYLVQSTLSNIDETVKKLKDKGFLVTRLGEAKFFFETIVCIEARRRLRG